MAKVTGIGGRVLPEQGGPRGVDNVASARVLVKVGLSREARLPEWRVPPNLPGAPRRDAFRYSWTR